MSADWSHEWEAALRKFNTQVERVTGRVGFFGSAGFKEAVLRTQALTYRILNWERRSLEHYGIEGRTNTSNAVQPEKEEFRTIAAAMRRPDVSAMVPSKETDELAAFLVALRMQLAYATRQISRAVRNATRRATKARSAAKATKGGSRKTRSKRRN